MNKLAEVTQAMSLHVTREALAQATDADLDNFEASAYHLQRLAFEEQCRREAARRSISEGESDD
jgi:hypothetical protein